MLLKPITNFKSQKSDETQLEMVKNFHLPLDAYKMNGKNTVDTLYSNHFQKKLLSIENPYGKGDATEKIMAVLKNEPIPQELKKQFYDL